MPDPRTVELIHARIDGELADGELAELEARLAADPGAGALAREIAELDRMLQSVPHEEPPAELAGGVMARVRAETQSRATPAPVPFETRARRRARFARAGLGLAAAIALAFVLVPSLRQGVDERHLSGTMGGAPATAAVEREFEMSGEKVRGSIRVSSTGDRVALSILFDDDAIRSVRVAFDPGRFALELPSATGAAPFTSANGYFTIEPEGREARVTLLRKGGAGSGRVSLSIVQDGDFYETSIDLD